MRFAGLEGGAFAPTNGKSTSNVGCLYGSVRIGIRLGLNPGPRARTVEPRLSNALKSNPCLLRLRSRQSNAHMCICTHTHYRKPPARSMVDQKEN